MQDPVKVSRFTLTPLLSLAVCLAAMSVVEAGPVLLVIHPAHSATNLLRNGDFEQGEGGVVTGWAPQPGGCSWSIGGGRRGSQGLMCESPSGHGSFGAGQTATFESTNLQAIMVRGWSKAANVDGRADSGYSIYVDVIYADGTPLWGQTANFHTGTHDWEERQLVLLPEKPIRRLTVYCLFRGHAGKVWFDDVTVEEVTSDSGALMFEGVPMTLSSARQRLSGRTTKLKTNDGLELRLQDQSIAGLRLGETGLTGITGGGFMARDVAAGSDCFRFSAGECRDLGLRLHTDVVARRDHLVFSGRVSDTTGHDRAISLFFALPLNATGWRWGDDIRHSRVIAGNGEFNKTVRIGCGATGSMSLYPLAAVYNEQFGLALAIDMGQPAVYRLTYHAGTQQLLVAYDFGLSPATRRFPGSANFRFVIFRFDPRWGFRSAFQKLTEIFPEYFRVRSPEQGLWMPFTDVSTVEGWEDFGFKYHEGNNNPAWDAAHGLLSFRYTEPMTWWMAMPKDSPRTTAEVLRLRDQMAASTNNPNRERAQVSQIAAMWDDQNEPVFQFRNEPWCNGAVWSLNPNPFLNRNLDLSHVVHSASNSPLNAATIHWNPSIEQKLYGPAAKAPLAGEYLDSLEGYTTADLNFRREHFQFTTVPLVFDTDTKQPALYKGLAVYEFTRWFCEDVHRLGKLTFANGVPYRFTFLCPWLDVLGTETDWLAAGKYQPAADRQMNLWRTMAGRKPYLLLMNTDFDQFTSELVERYFQRSLFFGMFPGMFSHNAADNPYWQNPKWYNRDRPLFKKYIPVIKRIAEAGWQPVTDAAVDNPKIWVERFGPDKYGNVYFTFFNDTSETQTGRLEVDQRALHLSTTLTIQDLLSGERWSGDPHAKKIVIPPQGAVVLRLSIERYY